MAPPRREEAGPHSRSLPRSDRARWITALSYKERQWEGLTSKGGEPRSGMHPRVGAAEEGGTVQPVVPTTPAPAAGAGVSACARVSACAHVCACLIHGPARSPHPCEGPCCPTAGSAGHRAGGHPSSGPPCPQGRGRFCPCWCFGLEGGSCPAASGGPVLARGRCPCPCAGTWRPADGCLEAVGRWGVCGLVGPPGD